MLKEPELRFESPLTRSQFFDQRRAVPENGLRRLQVGVFECAMKDYLFDRTLRGEVRNWVERRDVIGPFEFEATTAALEWNVDWTRAAMRRWMARVDSGKVKALRDSGDLRLRRLTDSVILARPHYRGTYRPRRRA